MTTPKSHSAGLRELLLLAWPVVVSRATQSIVGFSDAVMVSPLGNDAIAATTTGALNVFSLLIFPMGLVFIVQSFAAQLHGKGDPAGARRYALYGLVVAAALQVVALALLRHVGAALSLFGYSPEVRGLMADYLAIRFTTAGVIIATDALANYYGGLGNTRLPMIANLLTMVANIALNWVLIGGHLGAPALGVSGAALASAIAPCLGFGLIAYVFVADGRRLGAEGAAARRLRLGELLRMLRFGLPNGANWFLEFGAFSFFINFIVADLGTVPLAAVMAVFQVNSVSFMPAFGLASSGAILVGQAIGKGEKDEVGAIVRRTAAVAAVWQLFVGAAYVLFPAAIMSVFSQGEGQSDELVRLGAVLLGISVAWQLFDGAGMTLSEALRAAGDTSWTLGARVLLAWFVWVPSSYVAVAVLEGGVVAAMMSIVGYIVVLSVVLFFRFRSGAWRRIDLTGSEPELV